MTTNELINLEEENAKLRDTIAELKEILSRRDAEIKFLKGDVVKAELKNKG